MKPDRIYVVSPIWPTPSEPALGTFVKVISDGLAANGWDLDLAAVGRSSRDGHLAKLERYLRVCLGQLSLVFRQPGLVYIHVPTWFAAFAWPAVLLRAMPVAINLHGAETHSRKLGSRLAWPLTRRLIRRARVVIVPSETFARMVTAQVPGARLVVSASGGFTESRFHPMEPAPLRARLGFDTTDFVCGYVSRIVEGKGWRVFLDTIAALQARGVDARGFLIGSGSDAGRLGEEIAARGLQESVRYLGPIPQDQLKHYLGACDAFLFTSKIAKVDTLGLAAIEAAACGVPVMALDTPLMREYISPGVNGELAEAHTGDAFGDAVMRSRAWSSGSLADRQRVSASVARFCSTHVASSLSDVLRDRTNGR